MDDRISITVELEAADHEALSGIASDHAVSVAEIAAEAVHARVTLEREWEEAVQEGLADIAAGRTISHEAYLAGAEERRRRWIAGRSA